MSTDADWGIEDRRTDRDVDALEPSSRRCYRCDDALDEDHWIRLSTTNRGRFAHAFDDVDRSLCPDCVAAVGLLEPVPDRRSPRID